MREKDTRGSGALAPSRDGQAEWIVDAVNARIVPIPGYVSKTTATDAGFMKAAKAGV